MFLLPLLLLLLRVFLAQPNHGTAGECMLKEKNLKLATKTVMSIRELLSWATCATLGPTAQPANCGQCQRHSPIPRPLPECFGSINSFFFHQGWLDGQKVGSGVES